MKEKVFIILFITTIISAFGCERVKNPLEEEESSFTITGYLTDASDKPVKGAAISTEKSTEVTEEDGSFTIEKTKDGKLRIKLPYLKNPEPVDCPEPPEVVGQVRKAEEKDVENQTETSGRVKVYVKDVFNNPIANVLIEILQGPSASTDEGGFVSFDLNPNTSYFINISKRGFETQSIFVVTPQHGSLERAVILSKTGTIEVEPELIDFGKEKEVAKIIIRSSSGNAHVVLREDETWLSLSDEKVLVKEAKPEIIAVKIEREKLEAGKRYESIISVSGPNGFAFAVKVKALG